MAAAPCTSRLSLGSGGARRSAGQRYRRIPDARGLRKLPEGRRVDSWRRGRSRFRHDQASRPAHSGSCLSRRRRVEQRRRVCHAAGRRLPRTRGS